MTTIGDVFSVVAAILGIFLTLWSAVVAAGLLFPDASVRATEAIAEPKRCIGRGFLVLLVLGFLGVALMNSPVPLIKTVGVLELAWLLSLSVLGMSGLAFGMGRRIQTLDPNMAAHPANVRGAAFLVGGMMVPLLGWVLFGPVVLAASVGAGWRAVVRPVRNPSLSEVA